MFPFKKKESETLDSQSEERTAEIVKTLPEQMREQFITDIAEKVKINLSSTKTENHEYRTEEISPVITIGTELYKKDEFTEELSTATDKWGFHVDYIGTKGRIFPNEVPMFTFGFLGAMLPAMRNRVYRYTFKFDEKGLLERDNDGNPKIVKKERIHMGVELNNLKAMLNLGEGGYARVQQNQVIVGGYGQISPIGMDTTTEQMLEFAFGKKKK